jgi:hypothetical protein
LTRVEQLLKDVDDAGGEVLMDGQQLVFRGSRIPEDLAADLRQRVRVARADLVDHLTRSAPPAPKAPAAKRRARIGLPPSEPPAKGSPKGSQPARQPAAPPAAPPVPESPEQLRERLEKQDILLHRDGDAVVWSTGAADPSPADKRAIAEHRERLLELIDADREVNQELEEWLDAWEFSETEKPLARKYMRHQATEEDLPPRQSFLGRSFADNRWEALRRERARR